MLKCPKCGTENKGNARFCNDCGYMITEDLRGHGTLGRGILLDKYHILELVSFELGEALYKVEDKITNTYKFIKEIIILSPDEKLQIKGVERFKREIELYENISYSPILPKITDSFIEKSSFYTGFYIVFDYMEGDTLEEFINSSEENISENFLVPLACKICDSINILNNSKPPFFSFNLCPANIILNKNSNNILITDIPISRPNYGGGAIPKRVEFVAPERYEGKILPASDVYTIGATMHFLLTKIHSTPFIFKPLRNVRPELPKELEEIISTSLRLNPEKRFEDSTALKKAFEGKYGEVKAAGPIKNIFKEEKSKINKIEEKTFIQPQSPGIPKIQKPELKVVKETIQIKEPEIKEIKSELIKWSFQTGDKVSSSPIIGDDTVFIGSDDKYVYAINTQDGTEKWKFQTGSWVSTTPAFYDNKIYIGSRDGKIYCLNAFNGKKEWEFQKDESIFFNPIIANGILFIGSSLYEAGIYDEVLLALDAENGSRKWMFKTGGCIFHTPCILDNTIFIGTESGKVFALEVETGNELWNYDIGGRVYSSPVVSEDIIYITSEGLFRNGNIHLLNAEDGRYIWSMEFDKPFRSSVSVGEDIIYVSSLDKSVYAVDLNKKQISWKFETGGGIRCNPILHNDVVYVGSDDGCFYAIDKDTGNKIWDLKTGGALRTNPVAYKDNIFIGSRDGRIYSIKTSPSDISEEKTKNTEEEPEKESTKTSEEPQSEEQIIEYGKKLINQGDYNKALDIFEKIESADPLIIMLKGDIYKELGNIDKSIEYYEKASISGSPEIYAALGKVYSLKGDFDAATLAYDMALEHNEDCIDALFGKIQLFIVEKKFEEALGLLEKIEKIDINEEHKKQIQSRKIRLFLELGNKAIDRGEIASATTYFEKVENLPLSDKQIEILKKAKGKVFFQLGEKYSEEQNIELAIKFYRMCEETTPNSEIANLAKKRRLIRE